MKKTSLIFLWCLCLLIVGGGYMYWRLHHSVIQKVFRNKQVLDTFLASREVSVQRLHLQAQHNDPGILTSYDHDQVVSVAPAQFRQVQQLLQRHSSYDWETSHAKACIVDYGMVFTFRSGPRIVRIALCFNCNWVGIFDGPDKSARNINSEMDFDPIRSQLVAIAKTIYPSDSEIQGLK